jgi:glycosyltransferase involved in cell wall biosynthesis
MYVLNSPGGGATQGIVELLKGMPRDRYEHYLVIPGAPDEKQAEIFARLATETRVVPLNWWNQNRDLAPWLRLAIAASSTIRTAAHLKPVLALRKLIREWNIDIVYTTTALTIDGALAARTCGVPHIWHIKETVGRNGRVKFPLPDALLTRVFLGLSARVLVMTNFIGELFGNGRRDPSVVVVNDGVDVKSFEDAAGGSELRKKLGVGDDELLVAMVASLSSTWKRHSLFIQSAKALASSYPRVRFAIFGPEPRYQSNPAYNKPWQYFQGLRRQVEDSGLKDRFIWAGFHENIPEMMAAIDLVVHPCDIEPFGRLAIEAMAAGRPVIGPDRGGIAESVVHGETGLLVPAGNVTALADATARLIIDPDLRHRFGAAGRRHAEQSFSLEQHVRQIETIFTEVRRNRSDEQRLAYHPTR